MKVLIIGQGGREHALAWKIAQSSQVSQVFVAPGNAGTAQERKVSNQAIEVTDIDNLIKFAQAQAIDLTIVGPEAPLVLGIVDKFQQAGLSIFGPSQTASQLEGSKSFAKAFLQRHRIPTANYQHFTELDSAIHSIQQQNQFPIVIKADGLAAGKGVIIAENKPQAIDTVTAMLSKQQFGKAGQQIIIEDYLVGEEASFIVMVDGQNILPMATSQDHKARDNGDKGPNTGGMGAYSPAPVITTSHYQTIMETIIQPTVTAMAQEGMPYTGFLYAGLMLTADGSIKVLEYNCRLGDPETQPILMRLQSDLAQLCLLACQGKLDQASIDWNPQTALGVVMAAGGYPNQYAKGDVIAGLDTINTDTTKVFHAGTRLKNQTIVTNGGRVLCVCALGDTVKQAQQRCYQQVEKISWQNVYYRTDIAYRAI